MKRAGRHVQMLSISPTRLKSLSLSLSVLAALIVAVSVLSLLIVSSVLFYPRESAGNSYAAAQTARRAAALRWAGTAWIKQTLSRHAASIGLPVAPTRPGLRPIPPPERQLLALIGVHAGPWNGTAVRSRVRSTYERWLPPDVVLIFVLAQRGLPSPAAYAALAAEQDLYGDILLLDQCDEAVNTKSFRHFAIVSELFGASFQFYVKADTDAFVLPFQYAAMLRSIHVEGRPYIYGGNEFPAGRYEWSQICAFMQGGCYFMSHGLADVIRRDCPTCTNEYVYEDQSMGVFLKNHSVNPLVYRVRLNRFQTLKLSEGASGSRLLACFAVHLREPGHGCSPPPVLVLHDVKNSSDWAAIAHFYRARDAAMASFFTSFEPPENAMDAMVETEPDWYVGN